jgi:hypothetical protein
MIAEDRECQATLSRITWFQQQVARLRRTEKNLVNYRASSAGFLAEIDRMQRALREHLGLHPAEPSGAA